MELSVLIVDDEKVFRSFIADMKLWNEERFLLAGEARNTEEAMLFLEKRKVDVVILDVSMPGKDGVALSEMIAGKYPGTAMVAVSSYDDYDYVRQILKNGAHDYILKSRLSEELLERTLDNIEARMRQVSPWEMKKELRRQAADWLFHGGVNPFTSDNARKVVALVRITVLKSYPDTERKAMMEGIGRILEDGTEKKTDALAVYGENECFIVIYRFFEEVSEARIRESVENHQITSASSIRRVYGVSASMQLCPPFFSDKALRSFVLHKLEEDQKSESYKAAPLAMTIGQQNALLSAIAQKDAEAAEKLVREIYEGIGPEAEALYLIVTKELLDLLERISVEYEITLDFVPKDVRLFEYTKGKNREMLEASIAGLYRNVLREIGQRATGESYSELVNRAVRYMREHCHEAISLSGAAAGIGANSSYLSRVFHEETGMTFTDYLNRVRVDRATKLLQENLPLKDIASRCGFKNYGYFLKIFKDYTGKTPKEFLAQQRGKSG